VALFPVTLRRALFPVTLRRPLFPVILKRPQAAEGSRHCWQLGHAEPALPVWRDPSAAARPQDDCI